MSSFMGVGIFWIGPTRADLGYWRLTLKSTLKTVDYFPSCQNEIWGSFFNRIFCNTTTYFNAGQVFRSIIALLRKD